MDHAGYRPITGRALKSVMDTLRPELPETTILDLYAGSGSFGLATLKEGAHRVTFVEKNVQAIRRIEKEAAKLYLRESYELVRMEVEVYLGKYQTHFDIIFMDPPFADWLKGFNLKEVATRSRLLLVKCPSRMLPSSQFGGLTQWKSSTFGESTILYFRNGG